MSEQLVKAWKDPDYRETVQLNVAHPSGEALTEISDDELMRINGGADDVQAAAVTPTPLTSSMPCTVGIGIGTIVYSVMKC